MFHNILSTLFKVASNYTPVINWSMFSWDFLGVKLQKTANQSYVGQTILGILGKVNGVVVFAIVNCGNE